MARTPFPLISVPLSGVAINYANINRLNRGYIADRVARRRRVNSELFRWYRSNLSDAFTVYDTQIDRLGQANEIMRGWQLTEDSTKDYAIREPVPQSDENAAADQGLPFSLRASAVENVVNQIQLNREIRVATLCNSASSYLTGYSRDLATVGPRWSDYANSDPLADIMTARTGMLVRPNVATTNRLVMDVLRRHPKLSQAVGGSQNGGALLSEELVANLLGFREIIVGDTLYQTNKRGQTPTATGQIWGNHFAMHYQAGTTEPGGIMSTAGPQSQEPDFLTTFQYGDWVSSEKAYGPGDMGLRGGVKVLAGESVLERQVAPYAGYLFQNVIA